MLDGITNPVLSAYRVPDFYHAQQITGLLYLFPFAAFAAVPVITLLANLFKGRSATHSFGGHNIGVLAWLAITLGGSFLIAFCLLMVFFWVGTRYLGDFAPAMTALSLLGFLQGYQLSAGKPLLKNLYIFTAILLASVSILMSTLLAISINPGLIDLITEALPFFK
jgi:hypothetical protein